MHACFFPGPIGRLEGRIHHTHPENPWVLLLHPHPLYQGSMNNKVIVTAERSCQRIHLNTFAFNLRGTGQSENNYTTLKGAIDDARAAITYLKQTYQAQPTTFIGFSFGSYLATQLANEDDTLILLAPPIERLPFDTVTLPDTTLIIQGGQDAIANPTSTEQWQLKHPGSQYACVPEASHFFHQKLHVIGAHIQTFLTESLDL